MNRVRAYPLVVVLLSALCAVPGVSAAPTTKAKVAPTLSNQCVGAQANKNISECPGGPKQFDIMKKRSAAFKSAPPPRDAKARQDNLKPGTADVSMMAGVRDERTTRLKARARALLITEITGLERLYRRTRKKSPDRPQLVRRLAEGYVELASAANRDKTQSEIDAENAKKKRNRGAYDKSRGEAAKAKKIMKSARENAIKYYSVFKKDFPTYSKIDEVLYYLAYEYEQNQDLDNARKVYYELIQKAPKSKYVPNAYLAFGELFFVEAMADPGKWALAAEAYKQVLKYPPPENKVWGYAHYKLGYVAWNKGEYPDAIQEFKDVIEYSFKYPELPSAKQLGKAARRDLIPVYAVAGKPDRAYNFFKPLSGDKGGQDEKTIEMMNELGLGYLDTGHYPEAIVLYHDLMSRDKGERYCKYQTYVTQAVQAMKSGDKGGVVKELENQLAARKEFLNGRWSEKAKLECSNLTAELLAETAMSWHLEAVGSGGVRGTGSKDTMDKAAFLYKKVTENFTAQDFTKFQFPRIIKTDWPNLYKIRYAMADLLYFQQRWEDCGPAFDAVVAENPTSAEAPEAAYAAVLCYQKMYDQMYKGDEDRKGKGLGPKGAGKEDREGKKGEWEKFKPKPLSDMQKGMLTAFNRYVCYIKPPKGNKEAEEQYVEVKYARARTYFEAQHWEEAALGFRDVAINHADKDAAIYAAQLYLEALNVLGSRSEPPRPTCFEDMGGDVPVFLELFCDGKKFEDNKEQCELLTRIQCDIKRLRAEKLVELADQTAAKGQDALDKYKQGGDAYIELWRTYGEEQVQKGEASQCGKMDEILYNAARAYQAARLLAKSISVRRILLDPRYKLNETETAKKALYEIGSNYQAIAVYDIAADHFEKYAEMTKYKGEFGERALADAVVLRLGMGHDDKAIDDAAAFNRYYGAKKPEQTAQIAFAIGAHYAEKNDWKNARQKLQQGMRLIDKSATLDVQAQAHAMLGRAYVELNMEGQARGEYGRVIGLWKDPGKASAAIGAIKGEDEAGKQRRLGRALESVGEALFFFAEENKKKQVDTLKMPQYKGQKDRASITKHIQTSVKAWYEKKRDVIKKVSEDYKKIVDLQPVPPPRWAIAAGSRVGEMWGKFVDDFRSAPIPKEWAKDYEIRTAYYGALDDASEPFKRQAKGAYELCLDYSVKYQYFDEFSRACELWLSKNYKAEYHVVDEFRGAPTRVNSTLKERANPLMIGGEPYIAESAEKSAPKATKKEEE